MLKWQSNIIINLESQKKIKNKTYFLIMTLISLNSFMQYKYFCLSDIHYKQRTIWHLITQTYIYTILMRQYIISLTDILRAYFFI
jgi:hypothetical protein